MFSLLFSESSSFATRGRSNSSFQARLKRRPHPKHPMEAPARRGGHLRNRDDGNGENDRNGNDQGNHGSNNDGNSNSKDFSSKSSSSSTIKSDSSPSPSSSSSLSSDSHGPPSGRCFFCVDDTDPRILYTGTWVLGKDGTFGSTTHSTTTLNSGLSFSFNGSGIIVFGTIHSSNSSFSPPTTSYSIDAAPPFVTTQPQASHSFPNQPLFALSQLSTDPHELSINVSNVGASYSVDYFVVFPPNRTAHDDVTPSVSPLDSKQSSATSPSSVNQQCPDLLSALKIISVSLGLLVLLLVAVIAFLMWRMQRRLPRLGAKRNRSSTFGLGRGSCEKRQSTKMSLPTTIFTTTDSILRNNPSIMWTDNSSPRISSAVPNPQTASEKPVPRPPPDTSPDADSLRG